MQKPTSRPEKEWTNLTPPDSLAFQTEKQLKEYGDKIPEDKKGTIESALSALREAHKNEDMDAIDQHSEALNQAWQAASQDIYQATQGENGSGAEATDGGATGNAGGQDDVTDVEYEEVEDKG